MHSDSIVAEAAEAAQKELKAKLDQAKAEYDLVAAENSDFADGMRRHQTEADQLQAKINRFEHVLPSLNNEKASAAKARNFKEASRLNGEIKQAEQEKEAAAGRLMIVKSTISSQQAQNADVAANLQSLEASVSS
eukprot:COSAG02_NODE_40453_length_405_cov_1.016340_1_plen_134_part_11